MENKLKLDKFEGPLDLLLQLIEQEEVDIVEISLSKVTEQYFFYLNKLNNNRSEELADFLVIAAKLVYIKSKTLLPYLYPPEDDVSDLTNQLKMYKKYVEASVKVADLWNRFFVSYGRLEPPIKMSEFVLPVNAKDQNLRETMLALLRRLRPVDPLPQVMMNQTVSVKQRFEELRNLLLKQKSISFQQLLSEAKSRSEVIVNFLAILDLVKASRAIVKQGSAFAEMMIEKA